MTKDAWKQHHELVEEFSKVTEVRPDIKVYAYGCDRSVELVNLKADEHGGPRRTYSPFGKRNVVTMRELGEALIAACEFVEASNPEWAAKKSDLIIDV